MADLSRKCPEIGPAGSLVFVFARTVEDDAQIAKERALEQERMTKMLLTETT